MRRLGSSAATHPGSRGVSASRRFESFRPAIHGADQRELEITSEERRVRAPFWRNVIPGDHAGQALLNPLRVCVSTSRSSRNPLSGSGGTAVAISRYSVALGAAVGIRAGSRDPLLRRHAELGGAKREQHGCFECEWALSPFLGTSERLLETVEAASFDQRLDIPAGGGRRRGAATLVGAYTLTRPPRGIQIWQAGCKVGARCSWRHAVFRPFRHRVDHFGRAACSFVDVEAVSA
jgi:hypothetical protein